MDNLRELVSNIELKQQKLIRSYERLFAENEILKEENKIKEKEIQELNIKTEHLKEKVKNFNIIKSIESGKDNLDAKNKINELVREIDRCIALLNE